MTKQEIKERHFKKVYDNAPIIKCACGCGQTLKSKDHYARDRKFINGHNGRKYEDITQHKREWNHRNRKKRYEYSVKRSRDLKVQAIIENGGKCSICDLKYDGTNAAIFDFHHTKKKDIQLNVNAFKNYSLEKIAKELKKCVLVCSNCHRLMHSEKY